MQHLTRLHQRLFELIEGVWDAICSFIVATMEGIQQLCQALGELLFCLFFPHSYAKRAQEEMVRCYLHDPRLCPFATPHPEFAPGAYVCGACSHSYDIPSGVPSAPFEPNMFAIEVMLLSDRTAKTKHEIVRQLLTVVQPGTITYYQLLRELQALEASDLYETELNTMRAELLAEPARTFEVITLVEISDGHEKTWPAGSKIHILGAKLGEYLMQGKVRLATDADQYKNDWDALEL